MNSNRNDREYGDRVRKELEFYEDVDDVHALPESMHYLNNKYLRPLLLEHFPFGSFPDLVVHYHHRMREPKGEPLKILSLGSGNCDFELDLAREHQLDAHFHCLELNPKMLDRASTSAREKGLLSQFRFVRGDANELHLMEGYDLVLANYALHHFVELERIFEQVHSALEPNGYFLVGDMIGRNGHLFWEETLQLCNRIWELLPRELTYNHLLGEHFPKRIQWDCSVDGFEGIRAQDILPLLDHYFSFQDFAPFYCLVNRFTDRDFGPNFDLDNSLHRSILDTVWQYDHFCASEHLLKPTQMLAALRRSDAEIDERRFLYFEEPSQLYRLDSERIHEVFGWEISES